MASIYLVRHGQASFGADDYDKLSPLGCRQAQVLGEYFRDGGIHFDAAYSGDLLRQRETAELVLASQPDRVSHIIDPRFNEIQNDEQLHHLLPEVIARQPEVQGYVDQLGSSKSYQKVIEVVFNYWVSEQCRNTEVQSWREYAGNVGAALRAVIEAQGSGKTVAIFTSGGTVATLVGQVLGLGGESTYQFYEPVFNCSVSQLFYSGDKVSLSYFNDQSALRLLGQQLEENLISYR